MLAVDPSTEEVIQEYREHTPDEIKEKLDFAEEAFESWRGSAFEERAGLMRNAARELREGKAEYARTMTREMGKTLASSEAEVEKCAWVCDYFAENAARFLAPEGVATDATKSYVRFDPLGPVLAVMPWNFPFWQVFRFAAPALMAGNVGLLKHASNVPGCALAIEEVFKRAGFPKGAFQTLLISSKLVEAVIKDAAVKAVTLTGSEPAGSTVAAQAGAALKKSVLELGGSDPFVVLKDADLKAAASAAATARTINNGQSCIAAKRFIAERAIADEFEAAFTLAMAKLKVGDPMDPATDVGPLARLDLLEELQNQVDRAVKCGAIRILGGERLKRKGFFYPPTVLTNVEPGNPVFEEETFGPVAAVVKAEDEEHALALANASSFGLGASLWTADTHRGEELAERMEVGAVFINAFVKSDPRLPFGGVKRSGYGRELSAFGIREFVNVKSVWIK